MALISNQELLRRVPLFHSLRPEQVRDVADSVIRRRFAMDEAVIRQGTRSNALYILLSGRAQVLATSPSGREVFLATLQPGDYVGEMALIDNEPHSATVRAVVASDVLILAGPTFARYLSETPPLAHGILLGLVKRLRKADRQIESLALFDVYGRVARVLLDMAEVAGGVHLIRGRVSRKDVAKAIGSSREMVSRVMTDLESRGVIQTQLDGSVILKERLY